MNTYRIPAEFEPQESVLIVWPKEEWSADNLEPDEVTAELTSHLVGNVKVIIVCYDESVRKRALGKMTSRDIDISKIELYVHPIDNPYPRDFGAEVLTDTDGNKKAADFVFNEYCFIPGNPEFSFGEGMRDFNRFHAEKAGISTFESTWLVSEGGDREFNGHGVMMAIEETEVTKRNPGKTRQQVEDEFKRLLNLDKIIWIPQCSYDDENVLLGAIPGPDDNIPAYRGATANGHIDEICRFVSKDTILVAAISGEEASSSPLAQLNKERLDKAYKAVEEASDNEGKPFRIVRVPVPEPIFMKTKPGEYSWEGLKFFTDAVGGETFDGVPFPEKEIYVLPALSYCNFLITNNLVIAQRYWQEGMPDTIKEKDEQALNTLKELFPDRKVISINTLALNIMGGGIHCHTRNIPA